MFSFKALKPGSYVYHGATAPVGVHIANGMYGLILVDHSIFRAFNKGAIGMINAVGDDNAVVYSGRQDDRAYLPESGAVREHPGTAPKKSPAATKADRIERGRIVFTANCVACHQAEGTGIPRAFPPPAGSDFLNADVDRPIGIVANGLQGPITVNGEKFNSVMPRLGLSHEQIANVLTYVLNSWGNSGGDITPERVSRVLSGH